MLSRTERAVRDPDRLAMVRRVLDPPPLEGHAEEDRRRELAQADAALERISRLASALVGTPVSLVSLVEEDRQVFAAQVGLTDHWAEEGTPLSHSFCQHVVEDDAPLVIADAREDERLRDNLAIEDLGVIAYCGVPLRGPDGHVLGSFCVIDSNPHEWTDEEIALVEDLAALASTELLRRAALLFTGADRLAREMRRALSAVIGGFRTIAAARDIEHSDRVMYVALVERHARHLEELLDELLTDVGAGATGPRTAA